MGSKEKAIANKGKAADINKTSAAKICSVVDRKATGPQHKKQQQQMPSHLMIRRLADFLPLLRTIRDAHFRRYPRADHWAAPFTFTAQSSQPYEEIEASLLTTLEEEFKETGNQAKLDKLKANIDELEDVEPRICEYIRALLSHYNASMIQCRAELKAILGQMSALSANIKEQKQHQKPLPVETVTDRVAECSVSVYKLVRSTDRKHDQLLQLARVYHVPYFYDPEDEEDDEDSSDDGGSGNSGGEEPEEEITLREWMLVTYKHVSTIKRDLFIVTEALWYVRNPKPVAAAKDEDEEDNRNKQRKKSPTKSSQANSSEEEEAIATEVFGPKDKGGKQRRSVIKRTINDNKK